MITVRSEVIATELRSLGFDDRFDFDVALEVQLT